MNQRIFNVNTILNIDKNNSENANLAQINKIINISSSNSISNSSSVNYQPNPSVPATRYKVIKYLGDGIKGKLYLAVDMNNNNNRFICKQISIEGSNNTEINKQIEFELNILKYLSNNMQTREYINPCLEYKLYENKIYTLFPVFNGYSLENFLRYLSKMSNVDYYKISFILIKSILQAIAKIHNTHIAHQNINENSILISTFINPREINVKITDFGLGCGNTFNPNNSLINIEDYNKDNFFKFSSCKDNSNVPVKINSTIINQLKDSDYLKISQKYDLLCLGLLFIKILLYFEDFQINFNLGYNKNLIDNIK
jgi:serine/threonine protein kinase